MPAFSRESRRGLIEPISPGQAQLVRLAVQLFAKIGMGNRNQRLGAVMDAHAEKIDPAVFGHDVMDVAAAGDNSGTRRQDRDDAADGPVPRRAGDRNDRPPPRLRAAPRIKSTCPPMPE